MVMPQDLNPGVVVVYLTLFYECPDPSNPSSRVTVPETSERIQFTLRPGSRPAGPSEQ